MACRVSKALPEEDNDSPGLISIHDDGNYIIMDQAEADEGGMIRASGSMNAVQDPGRKQTSFMEKLMGVKNSQCELYLDKVHRELDQAKIRQIRNLQSETVKVQYDLKLMQVAIKRQEILEKKKADPRCDTFLDEAMIDKSAKYLQYNNVNPCYLNRSTAYPLRRSINSDYVSPVVNKARKALQDHEVEHQIEKVREDRKSVSQKSQMSRRSVHFQMDSPEISQPMDVDIDSEDKSVNKSQSASSESKSGCSSETPSTPILGVRKPRTTFSAKATIVSYLRPNNKEGQSLISRSSTGTNGYKYLLMSDKERCNWQSRPLTRSKTSIGTDVKTWTEQSAMYQSDGRNQNLLPHIANTKNNQDSLNNNNHGSTNSTQTETSSEMVPHKLDILHSQEDRNTFLRLVTSWKAPKATGVQSTPQSRVTSAVSHRRSLTASSSRKPALSHTMLKQEHAQIHWKLQNFYYRLNEDKVKAEQAAKAVARQKELKLAAGLEEFNNEQPLASISNPVARMRWQRAIRKVLNNLDEMLEHAYDDVPYALNLRAGTDDPNTSSEVKYLGGNFKGKGGPSNSLKRSTRHTATFKLQKVVAELLRNKSTFQKMEYEQTKQKLMETKEP